MGSALLLVAINLRAATFLWNGGSTGPGDSNWSTGTNWNPGTAPTTGGTNQDLQFAGSIRTSPNADGATAWAIRTITFNSGAAAFTVGGTTINLGIGGIVNSSSNQQTINNALSFTGAQTWNSATGDLTIGGTVALGTNALTFKGAHNINVTGALSGSGALATTAAVATVVTLSGNNSSYSGATTINGSATINAGNDAAFGTGALTLAGGTVAASGGSHSLANALSLTASSTVGGAQNLTFTGAFSQTGSNTLFITNTGTTAFTGSTFSLAENNQARTLTIDVAGTSGGASISGVVQNGTGSGADGLTKANSGTLTLSGSNTYTGATTVSAGTLVAASAGALGTAAATTTVASGAALQLQGGISVGTEVLTLNGTGIGNTGALRNTSGTNSWAGAVTLASATRINSDAGTLTVSGDFGGAPQNLSVGGSGNTTLSGAIGTGTGTLTKDGTGTLTLSGSTTNTFTGGLSLNDGTVILGKTVVTYAAVNGPVTVGDGIGAANSALLQLSQSNQIGSTAAVAINSDGKFDLNGNSQTIGNFSGSGTLAIASGGTLTTGDTTNTTFSGAFAGTGSLVKQGSGTLTIASNVSFGGTVQVNAGTFELTSAASGTTIGTLILNGGTLKLGAGTFNITNLQITGTSTIDFGNGVAVTLNGTNFSLSSGLPAGSLSIANWVNGVDYFFAQNWTNATLNTTGVVPMTQVTFNPSNASYGPTNTAWQTYGSTAQVTPAPEAGFYGAILTGLSLAGFALRRWPRAGRTRGRYPALPRNRGGCDRKVAAPVTALPALGRIGIL
jgi:autotransporter-associated beta strand protein